MQPSVVKQILLNIYWGQEGKMENKESEMKLERSHFKIVLTGPNHVYMYMT